VRRALYGSERLSALDLDSYLPDLIGPTEVLTDEYRKQLAKHLPARVEGMFHLIKLHSTDGVLKLYPLAIVGEMSNINLSLMCVSQVIPGRWCLARLRMDSASTRSIVK